ncbi:MAG: tRNA (adenosine(37)-N6)-threonylcarbamoyltransferase complex ATPase subunit type 1 TsaE [Coriobacteriia bacterium]|nr:tRNA (adenosine(37)-N6)-threonylcarbamoyltransferase complex ATPase subunit type 1 TsaE [Coriobacteriia bacterium]
MSALSFVMETDSAAATRRAGAALGAAVHAGDVVILTGDLGAGKTVIAQGVASALGVSGHVTSPTFNILVVHRGSVGLAHFDLYRLERAEQLEDIDFWGVVEGDVVSLIEWGDRFPEALPADVLTLTLEITGDESRRIAVSASGERSGALAGSWRSACAGLDGVAVPGGRAPR